MTTRCFDMHATVTYVATHQGDLSPVTYVLNSDTSRGTVGCSGHCERLNPGLGGSTVLSLGLVSPFRVGGVFPEDGAVRGTPETLPWRGVTCHVCWRVRLRRCSSVP